MKHTFARWPCLPQWSQMIPFFFTLHLAPLCVLLPQLVHRPLISVMDRFGQSLRHPCCQLPARDMAAIEAVLAVFANVFSAFNWRVCWSTTSLMVVMSCRFNSNSLSRSRLSVQLAMKWKAVRSSLLMASKSAISLMVDRRCRYSTGSSLAFCTDISHVPGLKNVVANTLSCQFDEPVRIVNTIAHCHADVDLQQLANDQELDEACRTASSDTSLNLELMDFPGVRQKILCDVSLQKPQIFMPNNWKRQIFEAIYSLLHTSGRTTLLAISRCYVWKGMNKQVKEWVKGYKTCARNKVARHTNPPSG